MYIHRYCVCTFGPVDGIGSIIAGDALILLSHPLTTLSECMKLCFPYKNHYCQEEARVTKKPNSPFYLSQCVQSKKNALKFLIVRESSNLSLDGTRAKKFSLL